MNADTPLLTPKPERVKLGFNPRAEVERIKLAKDAEEDVPPGSRTLAGSYA